MMEDGRHRASACLSEWRPPDCSAVRACVPPCPPPRVGRLGPVRRLRTCRSGDGQLRGAGPSLPLGLPLYQKLVQLPRALPRVREGVERREQQVGRSVFDLHPGRRGAHLDEAQPALAQTLQSSGSEMALPAGLLIGGSAGARRFEP